MDMQDAGAETSEPPPAAGKMNRTAFKLFVKRRSGSAMPSIFGVRSKGEATKGKGLPRSQTHDGLAAEATGTVALEASRNGDVPPSDPLPGDSEDAKAAARSASAKPLGFFSLLRKSGRGEAAPKQQGKAAGSAAKQRHGGLRGFLSGMQRWRRGSEPPPGEPEPLSASLTASMERLAHQPPPEELEPPAPEEDPRDAEEDESPLSSLHIEDIIQEAEGRAEESQGPEYEEIPPLPLDEESSPTPEEALAPPAPAPTLIRLAEPPSASAELSERVGLLFPDAASLKSFDSLTGCGDITAEPEEERPGEPRVEVEEDPPQQPPAAALVLEPPERPPTLLIYQGGGEEMASPEGVDDPELQDLLEAMPRSEEPALEVLNPCHPTDELVSTDFPPDRLSPDVPPSPPENCVSPDVPSCPTEDRVSPDLIPSPPKDLSHPSKHPSTFVQEDSSGCQYDESVPKESFSGPTRGDISSDPRHLPQPKDYHAPVTFSKPLSPVAATCPLKTATGAPGKDSKIPISRKHLPVQPLPSQVTDPVQQPPSKSEIPRTKIPVSRVLVRRVSNKAIPGSQYKSSTLQDTAKK